jgi:hypothetical protein
MATLASSEFGNFTDVTPYSFIPPSMTMAWPVM